jgi:hypothetical protein
MGVVVWRFGGPDASRWAAGEGEPVGVVNQPVERDIAKCVVTDHVVPVFNSPPVGHSAWRSSRPVAPPGPMSVINTGILTEGLRRNGEPLATGIDR